MDSGEVPRGEEMLYSGTDPRSYITECILVFQDVQGVGCRIQGSLCGVQGSGFRLWGSGLRQTGLGGSGSR